MLHLKFWFESQARPDVCRISNNDFWHSVLRFLFKTNHRFHISIWKSCITYLNWFQVQSNQEYIIMILLHFQITSNSISPCVLLWSHGMAFILLFTLDTNVKIYSHVATFIWLLRLFNLPATWWMQFWFLVSY